MIGNCRRYRHREETRIGSGHHQWTSPNDCTVCIPNKYSPMRMIFVFLLCFYAADAQQQQNPLTLNGGSVLAMAGDECVALAVDKRFGSGPQVRPIF